MLLFLLAASLLRACDALLNSSLADFAELRAVLRLEVPAALFSPALAAAPDAPPVLCTAALVAFAPGAPAAAVLTSPSCLPPQLRPLTAPADWAGSLAPGAAPVPLGAAFRVFAGDARGTELGFLDAAAYVYAPGVAGFELVVARLALNASAVAAAAAWPWLRAAAAAAAAAAAVAALVSAAPAAPALARPEAAPRSRSRPRPRPRLAAPPPSAACRPRAAPARRAPSLSQRCPQSCWAAAVAGRRCLRGARAQACAAAARGGAFLSRILCEAQRCGASQIN